TGKPPSSSAPRRRPQWSPVAVTGSTLGCGTDLCGSVDAAMEPGRGDRVDSSDPYRTLTAPILPQWSPVAVTGSTLDNQIRVEPDKVAAMEPGRGDRVDLKALREGDTLVVWPQWSPVAVTGSTPLSLCSLS